MTIAPNILSHVGFRLAELELIVTNSKGQLGRRNGVTSNILAFLILNLPPYFFAPLCSRRRLDAEFGIYLQFQCGNLDALKCFFLPLDYRLV